MDSNSNNSSTPLHDFAGLAKLLDDLGFPRVDKQTFRVVKEDLQKAIDAKNVVFDEDGIKYKFEGRLIKAYVYKKRYYVARHKDLPKFHIANCETIQSFIAKNRFESDYVISNAKLVDVIDIDNENALLENKNLYSCKNCLKLKNVNYTTTSEFGTIQEESDFDSSNTHRSSAIEVDINGYTKDWSTVSKSVRESKGYTCEACGFIPKPALYLYIHLHHINNNKIDNSPSNLQCLCIACHAKVDDSHRERFSKGDNLLQLNNFLKYKQESFK